MAGLGPCVLPVLEFANARAPELQALHELSQHKQISTCIDAKLETQKNQRRRRANAFKSHKIPQRLRILPKAVKNSLRCRKHNRRPHKLLQDRATPSVANFERSLWLSSHVWHTKRTIMTDQYGYILASHRADKSISAALEALRTKATLHDASYYGIIELYGLPQVILEALQLISDPEGSDFHGRRFLAGAEEGRSMLYHKGQFPQGAIAPVTFMWRPLRQDYEGGQFTLHKDWQNTKRQLWLWVHPAAYMEAATAIATACLDVGHDDEESIEMLDRRGQLCRLKLRGRLADELVTSIASGDGDEGSGEEEQDNQEEDTSDHEDSFDEKQTRINCCNGNRLYILRETEKKTQIEKEKDSIYAIAVKDPRMTRWKHGNFYHSTDRATSFSLLKEPSAEAVPKLGTDLIESPLSGLSLSSLGKDAEEPESKEILKEIQTLLAWTTSTSNAVVADESGSLNFPNSVGDGERTKFDVAKDDIDMNVEPIPNSLLWSLSKRLKIESNYKKDHKLNEEIYRQRKESVLGSTSYEVRAKSQALHLLIIKKREPYPHTSGWDIVCPPSSVVGLLKTLVFGGALVVGLEEDAALCTVLHQPSFPCDYPDTKAGHVYWDSRARDLGTEQAKKPKAVRYNFEKHGVKSPFRPRWELLFNLQKHEGDAEDKETQSLCVLRGGKYTEPFCFHRSSSTATGPGEMTSMPTCGVESVVPVTIPTLVRVVIVVPRRGHIDVNAMLLVPSAGDVEQFNNNKDWKGVDVCLPKKNSVKSSNTDERSLIGYVTSSIYDRPKGAFRAVGFIACEPLQQLYIANAGQRYRKQGYYVLAMLRSPHGQMVRPVLVQAQT
ncbi:unnamed protein product [Peronospora farinosa]|uniref:Uncharacterized protein n=1 Tax=Peronospora farinosa TaxID=134698 RepID=A0ABN8C9F7_9STRA|nr:unnamed protein product [Peronospora farinosa]